jgi:streptogramin lyase
MPRDALTRNGAGPRVTASPLGLAVAGVVFAWLLLGSSLGSFGVGDAFAASVGQVSEFSIPTAHSAPDQIAAGPDGNLWFTESGGSQIGRITPTGQLTEYSVPTADGAPEGIAAGPDGNLWFTDEGIARITPAGQITEYPIPTADGNPGEIVAGPDDNLWFTDDDGIGRITLSGQITQYALPSPDFAVGITAEPDGDVWFTDVGSNAIGRITTGSGFTRPGQVTEYPIPTPDSGPNKITAGPDGNAWFTEVNDETVGASSQIGRITPAGQITEYRIPTALADPVGIAAGADGNLWFAESGGEQIGRITPVGQITEYRIPTAVPDPLGIAAGPDGNVWFTEYHVGNIGRILTGAPAASAIAPSVTGSARRGDQVTCEGEQWADWAGRQPVDDAPGATPPGVQWLLGGAPIAGATARTYTLVGGEEGDQLTCTVTAFYPVLDVTVSATSAGVTVLPPGGPTPVREFPAGSATSGIAAGPDGNLWFTEFNGNTIGRITPAGEITRFPVPTGGGEPDGIAAGPDGNLWFAEYGGDKIGRISLAGQITEYSVATADSDPSGIAIGPDGNLWFTEPGGDKVGRITPAGQITEYPIPTPDSQPYRIAAAADGNLWFTEPGAGQIGRITPAGQITEYPVPAAGSSPDDITAGPDGNLWFTERYGNQVGRITPAGQITEYTIPTANSQPIGITVGPDGNLWFTEYADDQIGRITPAGQITEYPIPTDNSDPWSITTGADGNLWFAENGGSNIGQVLTGAGPASMTGPSVAGSALQGTQQACQGEVWADWAGQQPVLNASTTAPPGLQWLLDGTPIAGATGQTYTPVASDVGHQLACAVDATYPLVRVTVAATSAGVKVLAPPPAPTPTPTPTPTPKPKPGKPTSSRASFSNVTTASPTLSFTVTAGDNAEPIKSIAVEPPRGISFTRRTARLARAISIKTPSGRQLKFNAKVSHGMLTITLAATARTVQVRIAKSAIAVSKTLVRKAKHKQVKKLSFGLRVTDSAKTTTKLKLKNVKV